MRFERIRSINIENLQHGIKHLTIILRPTARFFGSGIFTTLCMSAWSISEAGALMRLSGSSLSMNSRNGKLFDQCQGKL